MRSKFHGSTYNNHPLNISNKNHQGFYTEILEPIDSLMEHMVGKYSQVLFVRFDLTYPANTDFSYQNDNNLFSRFIGSLTRQCKRWGFDPQYLWARELSPHTGQFHYHVMMLLNGRKIQDANIIFNHAIKLWNGYFGRDSKGGLVHKCKEGKYIQYGGIKIRRNAPDFPQVLDNCFERASYLAKCYTKGQSPAGVNEFGSSRLY